MTELADPPAFLHIDQLSHRYPASRNSSAVDALDRVTMAIAAGEMIAFLGPNGSGKTTLLQAVTTMIKPTAGSLRCGEIDLRRDPAGMRRLLGVVFQKSSLDIKMTVAENLRSHGQLYGVTGGSLCERLDQVLDELGLAERRRDLVQSLSGGLARRVELAKALITRPRLLVLDEPTTGLDPVARQEFWQVVRRAREQTGVTVITSTHMMEEAARCDRVAILHRGRLLALDSPTVLQSRVGGEVVSLWSDDLEGLREALNQTMGLEGKIIDDALRLTLDEAVGVDRLLEEHRDRIQRLSVAHPSLDDVFVQFTGEHLNGGETR